MIDCHKTDRNAPQKVAAETPQRFVAERHGHIQHRDRSVSRAARLARGRGCRPFGYARAHAICGRARRPGAVVKILLATDAWAPQVNGVVRTLTQVIRELGVMGHRVSTVQPALFRSIPCPFYPEIRLALGVHRRIGNIIEAFAPDAVHIATEGPVGLAVRRWCRKHGYEFTTAFHTRFPEYLADRRLAPRRLIYALLRRFHAPATAVMVPSASIRAELSARGFAKLVAWGRGVDPELFSPARGHALDLPRPIFLSVGRVAPEKNLPAFLSLDLPGSKLVIGEGPQLAALRQQFPQAHFLGRRTNGELAGLYAAADVFVFPSRTDTFGLVMLEALASGLPVAAYPVAGPLDVIGDSGAGVLDEDLRRAAMAALEIPREHCRAHALNFTWRASATQFLQNLRPCRRTAAGGPQSADAVQ
jgi:glycosyltransferase involved in cell wall biosynthesis